MSRNKLAGISAIAFVLLSLVIVAIVPPFPTLASDSRQVVEYYQAHRLPFLIGNYLAALAAVPSFVALAYLVNLVKRAEGGSGWLWIMVLGTALVAHAVGCCVLFVYQAVAVTGAAGNPELAKAISDLASMGFGFYFVIQFGFCLAVFIAIWRTRALQAWLGYLALAVAPLSFLGSLGSIVTTGPIAAGAQMTAIAFGAFMFWNLCLGIAFFKT